MVVLGGGAISYEPGIPVVLQGLDGRGYMVAMLSSIRNKRCFVSVHGYLTYKKTHPHRTLPQAYARVLGGSWGSGRFLMGRVPL